MPVPSQRPLVAKLLALEPMTIGDTRYDRLEHILEDMGRTVSPEDLVTALKEYGVAVSVSTLYRWRAEDE